MNARTGALEPIGPRRANHLGQLRLGERGSRAGVSRPRARSAATARAALVQAVCWVRIAPTAISKAVRPGHHCWGPKRRSRSR